MTIQEIYNKYKITKNLQEHMLRVGALCEIITNNWTGNKINKRAVVIAALLHDIAKPISFDLAKQAKFGMTPAEINDLTNYQKYLKRNFGEEEHEALIGIAKYLSCDKATIRIIGNTEWNLIPELIKNNDNESLIEIYGDMRISPNGIVLLSNRLDELKNRKSEDNHEAHMRNGIQTEKIINRQVSINLNLITDESINSSFKQLLNKTI